MNSLQVFNSPEFGEIRTVDIDGKPYAVGNDIARALEYANANKAVRDHCQGAVSYRLPTNGGVQDTKVIPEGDIYRLIVKAADQSRNVLIKEKAGRFERWLFDEAVPEIRHTGGYAPAGIIKETASQMSAAMMTLLPAIAAETVKQTLAAISSAEGPEEQEQKKKQRVNYHSKMSRLPAELRNEVIYLIFAKGYTYMKVRDILRERGHSISATGLHRFAHRLLDSAEELGVEIEE